MPYLSLPVQWLAFLSFAFTFFVPFQSEANNKALVPIAKALGRCETTAGGYSTSGPSVLQHYQRVERISGVLQSQEGPVSLSFDIKNGELILLKAHESLKLKMVSAENAASGLTYNLQAPGQAYQLVIYDNTQASLFSQIEKLSLKIGDVQIQSIQYDFDPKAANGFLQNLDSQKLKELFEQLLTLRQSREVRSDTRAIPEYPITMRIKTCGQQGNILERILNCIQVNGLDKVYRRPGSGDFLLVSAHEPTTDQYWLDLNTGILWAPPLRGKFNSKDVLKTLNIDEPIAKELPSLKEIKQAYDAGLESIDHSKPRFAWVKAYLDGVRQWSDEARFFAENSAGEPSGLFLTHDYSVSETIWYLGKEAIRGVLHTPIHWPEIHAQSKPVFKVPAIVDPPTPMPPAEKILKAFGPHLQHIEFIDADRILVFIRGESSTTIRQVSLSTGESEEIARLPPRIERIAFHSPWLLVSFKMQGGMLGERWSLFGHTWTPRNDIQPLMGINLESKKVMKASDIPASSSTKGVMGLTTDGKRLIYTSQGINEFLGMADLQEGEPQIKNEGMPFYAAGLRPGPLAIANISGYLRIVVGAAEGGVVLESPQSPEKWRRLFKGHRFNTLSSSGAQFVYAIERRLTDHYLVALDMLEEKVYDIAEVDPLAWKASGNTQQIAVYGDGYVKVYAAPDFIQTQNELMLELPAPQVNLKKSQSTLSVSRQGGIEKIYTGFAKIGSLAFRTRNQSFVISNNTFGIGILDQSQDKPVYRYQKAARYQGEHFEEFALDGDYVWYVTQGHLHRMHLDSNEIYKYPVQAQSDRGNDYSLMAHSGSIVRIFGSVLHNFSHNFWTLRQKGETQIYRLAENILQPIIKAVGGDQAHSRLALDVDRTHAYIAGPLGIAQVSLTDFKVSQILLETEKLKNQLKVTKDLSYDFGVSDIRLAGQTLIVATTLGHILVLDVETEEILDAIQVKLEQNQHVRLAVDTASERILITDGEQVWATRGLRINWLRAQEEQRAEINEFIGRPGLKPEDAHILRTQYYKGKPDNPYFGDEYYHPDQIKPELQGTFKRLEDAVKSLLKRLQ